MAELNEIGREDSLNIFQNLSTLTEYLKDHAQPIDISKTVNPSTRVLCIGETHLREQVKQFVIDQLPQLRQLGFNHLCLEMVPAHLQPFLDHLDDEKFKMSLLKYFQDNWNASPNSPQLYLDMLCEAKKLGFNLKAIGLSLPNVDERNAQVDEHMATLIKDIVSEDPNNKVVSFTGNMHATLDRAGMAGIIKASEYETVSVWTQGGAKAVMPTLVDTAAEQTHMSEQQFMIPLEPTSSTYNCIWHFPQTEPATEYEERVRNLPTKLRSSRFSSNFPAPSIFFQPEEENK